MNQETRADKAAEGIKLTDDDRLIYEKEIRPWLPDRIFDAHAHLIANRLHPDLADCMPLALKPELGNINRRRLEEWWRALLPDAHVSGLLMGMPTRGCDWRAENAYVAGESRGSECRFSLMTHPGLSPEELEADILEYQPAGLKPYMAFTDLEDPNTASITDMIPEAQVAVADKYGLAVTLHVAKLSGMADLGNLETLARLVRAYPRCNFILAHCGRCFITPNMEATLEGLPVAENLWMDTSAVCDVGVFITLLRGYDRGRILFGTDLVTATGFRGRYVRLGMSWHVCTEARVSGLPRRATFAAYENLSALCYAARFCGLTDQERRQVFWENAARLFELRGHNT